MPAPLLTIRYVDSPRWAASPFNFHCMSSRDVLDASQVTLFQLEALHDAIGCDMEVLTYQPNGA